MAWDKVTKVDSIAKRKAWTKSNLGVFIEHAESFKRADINRVSIVRGNNAGQMTVTLSKRGRLHRRVAHGSGNIATTWPTNSK
jgi:hypothetical protein